MRLVAVGIGALLLLAAVGAGADDEVRESRAIYDEEFHWITPQGLEETLSRIRRAGFNVFIPAVWHGRGTTWPSQLAPREPAWEKAYRAGYDPLAQLIGRAHAMGIEVHPWFTVALRQREFLPEFYDDGTPEESFNVHLPEFRRYIVQLMMEVVRNYDLDGINLDYIRARGTCISDLCAADYRAKFGRNLQADLTQRATSEVAGLKLDEWQGRAVSDIVQSTAREARRIKPKLIISADSKAASAHWKEQGADSVAWANHGWIDVIFHMDYQAPRSIDWATIKRALGSLKDPDQLVLAVGNYETSVLNKRTVWPRHAQTVAELVETSQRLRPRGNGTTLYSYFHLTEAQIESLRKGPFNLAANPGWKKRRAQR